MSGCQTYQRLEERRPRSRRPLAVRARALPVRPKRHVLQSGVVPAILEILAAEETGPATGINEVIERDRPSDAV